MRITMSARLTDIYGSEKGIHVSTEHHVPITDLKTQVDVDVLAADFDRRFRELRKEVDAQLSAVEDTILREAAAAAVKARAERIEADRIGDAAYGGSL